MKQSDGIATDKPNLSIDGVITATMKSGKHFSYKIHTVRAGPLKDKRIVSLMTGPDNISSWTGFGFVIEISFPTWIRVWSKFKQSNRYPKHAMVLMGKVGDHVTGYLQAGKCRRCGRRLTTPESITRGLGPECFKKER